MCAEFMDWYIVDEHVHLMYEMNRVINMCPKHEECVFHPHVSTRGLSLHCIQFAVSAHVRLFEKVPSGNHESCPVQRLLLWFPL